MSPSPAAACATLWLPCPPPNPCPSTSPAGKEVPFFRCSFVIPPLGVPPPLRCPPPSLLVFESHFDSALRFLFLCEQESSSSGTQRSASCLSPEKAPEDSPLSPGVSASTVSFLPSRDAAITAGAYCAREPRPWQKNHGMENGGDRKEQKGDSMESRREKNANRAAPVILLPYPAGVWERHLPRLQALATSSLSTRCSLILACAYAALASTNSRELAVFTSVLNSLLHPARNSLVYLNQEYHQLEEHFHCLQGGIPNVGKSNDDDREDIASFPPVFPSAPCLFPPYSPVFYTSSSFFPLSTSPSPSVADSPSSFFAAFLSSSLASLLRTAPLILPFYRNKMISTCLPLLVSLDRKGFWTTLLLHLLRYVYTLLLHPPTASAAGEAAARDAQISQRRWKALSSSSGSQSTDPRQRNAGTGSSSYSSFSQQSACRTSDSSGGESKDISPTTHSLTVLRFLRQQLDHVCTHPPLAAASFFICARLLLASTGGGSLQLVGREAESVVSGIWLRKKGRAGVCLLGGREVVRVMGELARVASVRRNVWPVLLQPPETALLPLLVARAGSCSKGLEGREGIMRRRRTRGHGSRLRDRNGTHGVISGTVDEAWCGAERVGHEGRKRSRAGEGVKPEARTIMTVVEEQRKPRSVLEDEPTPMGVTTSEAYSSKSLVDGNLPSLKKRRTGSVLDSYVSAPSRVSGCHVSTSYLSPSRVVSAVCCDCNTRCWRQVDASRLDDLLSSGAQHPSALRSRSPLTSCEPGVSLPGVPRPATSIDSPDQSTPAEGRNGSGASLHCRPIAGLLGAAKNRLVASEVQGEAPAIFYSTSSSGSCSRSPSPAASPSPVRSSTFSTRTESRAGRSGYQHTGLLSGKESEATLSDTPGSWEEADKSHGASAQQRLLVPCRFCRQRLREQRGLRWRMSRKERRGVREASLQLFLSGTSAADESVSAEDRRSTYSDSSALGSGCGPNRSRVTAAAQPPGASADALGDARLSSRVPLFDWLLALPPSTFLCSLLLPAEQVRDMHFLFSQMQLLSSAVAQEILQPAQKGGGSHLTGLNSDTPSEAVPLPSTTGSSGGPANTTVKKKIGNNPTVLPFLVKAAAASQAFIFEAFHQNWLVPTGISGNATNPAGGQASASSFSSSWFPPFVSDVLRLAVLLSDAYAVVEVTADSSQITVDQQPMQPRSSGPHREGFRSTVSAASGDLKISERGDRQEMQSEEWSAKTMNHTSALLPSGQGETEIEPSRMLSKPLCQQAAVSVEKFPVKIEGEDQDDSCSVFSCTSERWAKKAILFHNVRISCPSIMFVRWLLVSVQQGVAFPFSVLVSAHTRLALCLDWLTFLPAHLLNPKCFRPTPTLSTKSHSSVSGPSTSREKVGDPSAGGQAGASEGAGSKSQDGNCSQRNSSKEAADTVKYSEGGTTAAKPIPPQPGEKKATSQDSQSVPAESGHVPSGLTKNALWETVESCQAACEHTQQLLQIAADSARAASTAARAAASAAASAFVAAQQEQMLFIGSGEKMVGAACPYDRAGRSFKGVGQPADVGDHQGMWGAVKSAVLEKRNRQSSLERKQGDDAALLGTRQAPSTPRGDAADAALAGVLGYAGRLGGGREERIAAAREAARETVRRAAAALPKVWDVTPFQDDWLYDAVVLPLLQFLIPCKKRQSLTPVQGDDGNARCVSINDSLYNPAEQLRRTPCLSVRDSFPSGSARLARLLPFGSLSFQLVLEAATNPRDAATLLDFFGQTLASYSPSSLPVFLPSVAAALAAFALLQLLLLHGETPIPGALGRTRPAALVLTAALQNQTLPGLLLRQAGFPIRVVYKRLGLSGAAGTELGEGKKAIHSSAPSSLAARGQEEGRTMPRPSLGDRDTSRAYGTSNQAGGALMRNQVGKGSQGSQAGSVGLERASVASDEDENANREKKLSLSLEVQTTGGSACSRLSPGKRMPSSTVSGSSVSDVASSRSPSVQSVPHRSPQRSFAQDVSSSQAPVSCDFALHLGGGGGSAEKRTTLQIHPLLTHCCIAAIAMVAQIASRPRAYHALSEIRWRPSGARSEDALKNRQSRVREDTQQSLDPSVRLVSQTKSERSNRVPNSKEAIQRMDEMKGVEGPQADSVDGRNLQSSGQQPGMRHPGTFQQTAGKHESSSIRVGQQEEFVQQAQPGMVFTGTERALGTTDAATLLWDERRLVSERRPSPSDTSDLPETDLIESLSSASSSCICSDSSNSVFSEEDADDAALDDFFFGRAGRDVCFPIERSRVHNGCDLMGRKSEFAGLSRRDSMEGRSYSLSNAPCLYRDKDQLTPYREHHAGDVARARKEVARNSALRECLIPRYRVPFFLQLDSGTTLSAKDPNRHRRGGSFTAAEVANRNSSLDLLDDRQDRQSRSSSAVCPGVLPRKACFSTRGTRSRSRAGGLSAACGCRPSGIWRCLLKNKRQPLLSLVSYVVPDLSLLSSLARSTSQRSCRSEDSSELPVGGEEERPGTTQACRLEAAAFSGDSRGSCVTEGNQTGEEEPGCAVAAQQGGDRDRKRLREETAGPCLAALVRRITRAVARQLKPPDRAVAGNLSGTGWGLARPDRMFSRGQHCGTMLKTVQEYSKNKVEGSGHMTSHVGVETKNPLFTERAALNDGLETLRLETVASVVAKAIFKEIQQPGQKEEKGQEKQKQDRDYGRREGGIVKDMTLMLSKREERGLSQETGSKTSGHSNGEEYTAGPAALSSCSSIPWATQLQGDMTAEKESNKVAHETQAPDERRKLQEASPGSSPALDMPTAMILLSAIADQLQEEWYTRTGTCHCDGECPPTHQNTASSSCRTLRVTNQDHGGRGGSTVSESVQGITRTEGRRTSGTQVRSLRPYLAGVVLWGAVLAEMAAAQRSPRGGDECKASEAAGRGELSSSNSMPVGFAALWYLAHAAGTTGSVYEGSGPLTRDQSTHVKNDKAAQTKELPAQSGVSLSNALKCSCGTDASRRLRLLLELYGVYVHLMMRDSGCDTPRTVVERDLAEGVTFLFSSATQRKTTRENSGQNEKEGAMVPEGEDTELHPVTGAKGGKEADCGSALLTFFCHVGLLDGVTFNTLSGALEPLGRWWRYLNKLLLCIVPATNAIPLYRLPSFVFSLFVGSPILLKAVLHTSSAQQLEELAMRSGLATLATEDGADTAATQQEEPGGGAVKKGTEANDILCSCSTSALTPDPSSFCCALCSSSSPGLFFVPCDTDPRDLSDSDLQAKQQERNWPISKDHTRSGGGFHHPVEATRLLPFFTLPEWHEQASIIGESHGGQGWVTRAGHSFSQLARAILFPCGVFRPGSSGSPVSRDKLSLSDVSQPRQGDWSHATQASLPVALRWRSFVLAWRLFAREMEVYHLLTHPSADFLSRPLFSLRVRGCQSGLSTVGSLVSHQETSLRPGSALSAPPVSRGEAFSCNAEESNKGLCASQAPLPRSLGSADQALSLPSLQNQTGFSSCEVRSSHSVSSRSDTSSTPGTGSQSPFPASHSSQNPTQTAQANQPRRDRLHNNSRVSSASTSACQSPRSPEDEQISKDRFAWNKVSTKGAVLLWQTPEFLAECFRVAKGIPEADISIGEEGMGSGGTGFAFPDETAEQSDSSRKSYSLSYDPKTPSVPLPLPVFLLPPVALPRTTCTLGSLSPLLTQVLSSVFALLFRTQKDPESSCLGRSVGTRVGGMFASRSEMPQEEKRSLATALSVPFISLTPLMAALRPRFSLLRTVLLALARASPPVAPPGPSAYGEPASIEDRHGKDDDETEYETLIIGALVTWLIRWYENDPCRLEQMILILKLQPHAVTRVGSSRVHPFCKGTGLTGIGRSESARRASGEDRHTGIEKQQQRRGTPGPDEEELQLQRRAAAIAKKEEDEGVGFWSRVTVQVAAFATRHAAASFREEGDSTETSSVVLGVRLPLLRLVSKKRRRPTGCCSHLPPSGPSISPPEGAAEESSNSPTEAGRKRPTGSDGTEEEVDEVPLAAVHRFCEILSAPLPQSAGVLATPPLD